MCVERIGQAHRGRTEDRLDSDWYVELDLEICVASNRTKQTFWMVVMIDCTYRGNDCQKFNVNRYRQCTSGERCIQETDLTRGECTCLNTVDGPRGGRIEGKLKRAVSLVKSRRQSCVGVGITGS